MACTPGGFFGFVLLLALLEQHGRAEPLDRLRLRLSDAGCIRHHRHHHRAPPKLANTTSQAGACRRFYNGMATGADWMSAASFVGMAGTLFLLGYDGLAFVLGWTGGYVLVAILIAPYLRKFGAYTVPDFFAERFGGNFTRFLAVIVLVCCSFTYVTAQIYGTGLIASRFLDINFTVAVYVGLVGILLCSMLGGMKAVTWTQVAQYIVLIVAYLTPIIILSSQKYGIPVPQLTYGQALQDIAAREQQMIQQGLATAAALKPHAKPFTSYDPLNYFALILCLMVGTASLPHILMRYFTTPSVRDARMSVAWSLFFIFLLYFSAPAYAAFSKLEVYSRVIGRPLDERAALAASPMGNSALVKVCGVDAVSIDAIKAACMKIAGHPGVIRLADLNINTDVIVLSTPEIAGMPYVIAGLVAAGGLAAALSTADGLLLAIANALSHDVYYKMIAPNVQRWQPVLSSSRILLFVVALFAAYTASTRPVGHLAMVAWAFSLAAAGIFPALVLGIWWKRANSVGCVVGMIVGFGLCLFYLVVTRYFPGAGVAYFGMSSLLNPVTGAPIVDLVKTHGSAQRHRRTGWQPPIRMASKVGWMDVNNISSALFSCRSAS